MSEEPNAGTPPAPRDGSWPRASGQPSAPQPVVPPEPAAPVNPAYPQQQYPQQPYPQQGQQQYPPQGQQYPQQYPPQGQQYPQQYPQQGYQQQVSQQATANTVQLNYWLSVFFSWIPALIFYVNEKGKNQLADEYHRQNLNFALVRVICSVGIVIPYLGFLFFIAAIVLFVFHIMAAASAQSNFNRGQLPKFVFNLNLVK